MDVIGDRWSLLIVCAAIRGKQRFGEFQESLGLAKNILSVRLKKHVEGGIMTT
ncbi:winged helix-turn-helix transcriptional regulator [Rhizobium sp. 2YAF20]|uniref:winged helix-turn-helix transcriptional regulator n=1 Tax=Rhizobium sp. 2YAF20 TaxID=3233027 RepID=UPI003F9E0CC3